MSIPVPSSLHDSPIVAAGSKPIAAARWRAVPIAKGLMPYEAAAKAIFIRANGAPAYYKATGIVQAPTCAIGQEAPAPSREG